MYSVFQSLVGKPLRVELKNGLVISAVLYDIDLFLNLKLSDAAVESNRDGVFLGLKEKKVVFIRGSSVKFAWIQESDVCLKRMEDSVRNEMVLRELQAAVKEDAAGDSCMG